MGKWVWAYFATPTPNLSNLGGIKNEGLKVVGTPPNSSPSFLKKLSNKVIELLSLPLLYSPSFFKLPNMPLVLIITHTLKI